MPATLSDIAKKVGVSINTVSHALRDLPDISPEMTALIKKEAASLGYRKNLAASQLRTSKSYILGIIITDISNPVFSGMIKSIESVCSEAGYTLMVGNSNENSKEENIIVRKMLEHGADGIFLVPTMHTTSVLEQFNSTGVPYIVLQRRFTNISANYVQSSDFKGGRLAAEHLYRLGHRSFLYISGPMYISSAAERYRGFTSFLSEKGIGGDAVQILECDGTRVGSYEAMATWLSRHEDVHQLSASAIFCFSDYMACGVYSALFQYNLSVPEDISIIGYDNNEYSDMMLPPLTTIDICPHEIGRQAARLLLDKINHKEQSQCPREIVIPPQLIPRDSTAPV